MVLVDPLAVAIGGDANGSALVLRPARGNVAGNSVLTMVEFELDLDELVRWIFE
jgi:hypothetical protein